MQLVQSPHIDSLTLPTTLEVELCQDSHAWDTYADQAADAAPYHFWYWKQVVEETYSHRSYYLAARSDGHICGILPLSFVKSRLFGRFLVSMPFASYGGVLADTRVARDALLARAIELGRELGAASVELRQPVDSDIPWESTTGKVTMFVPLPSSSDELWQRLPGRLRNKIRNAEKHGMRVEWGHSELLPAFYAAFAENMRNLGTPVYPRRWFESILAHAGEQCRILVLWDGSRPAAATLSLGFRSTLELPWIASTSESRKKNSTVLLYWTAMQWAIQQGYSLLDLGRCTPGGGTYEFKRQWGCQEQVLPWYRWMPAGTEPPNVRTTNPKYRLAINVWRHLPLWVANALGPAIVRSIP